MYDLSHGMEPFGEVGFFENIIWVLEDAFLGWLIL